jgi:hypothetical protein
VISDNFEGIRLGGDLREILRMEWCATQSGARPSFPVLEPITFPAFEPITGNFGQN